MIEDGVLRRVPNDVSERRALVFERPDNWEYALYGATLAQELEQHAEAWNDHQIGYVPHVGAVVRPPNVRLLLDDSRSHMIKLLDNFNNVLTAEAQLAAFGDDDRPGDPVVIGHLATRLIDTYGHLLQWAAELRSARVPNDCTRAVDLLARFADQPLYAIRTFVADYIETLNLLLEDIAVNGPPPEQKRLEFVVKLEVPEGLSKAYGKELRRLRRRVR